MDETRLISSLFTMVARDVDNKPVPVNPLEPETEEEKRLFEEGLQHAKFRKIEASKSLQVQPPTDEERALLHNLYLESKKSKDYVWMKDTGKKKKVNEIMMNHNLKV